MNPEENKNPGTEPTGADRRRERRVEFVSPCTIKVTAPVWAITPAPIPAMTRNITANGLRVDFQDSDPQRLRTWSETVQSFEELRVSIQLASNPDFPELKGQIVWLQFQDNMPVGEDDFDELRCEASIGILFSIMSSRVDQALLSLIESLPSD